jgi:PAS domain S-box-containing protein
MTKERDQKDKHIAELKAKLADCEQREAEVRRQARGFQTLIERLPKVDAARFDEHGRFQYTSPGIVRTHGVPAEDLLGRRPSETSMDREFAAVLEDSIEKVINQSKEVHFQYAFELQSGQIHRAYTLILEEKEEDDPSRTVLLTSYDITDLKVLAGKLREALDEAERANRIKSEFLANMSHEIRTPMNGVIGMTELALQENITARAREYLQMVKQSGQILLSIVNDILDLAKIEAGKVELEKQPFDIREIVESTLKPLMATAKEKGLEFLYSFDPEISGTVEGDSGRLRQVLTNIVSNAIKFTAHGRVAISVNLAEIVSPESVHILFIINDDGIGIPMDKLSSIFTPFAQAGGSAHVNFGGTGLGLAISKDLVEMMGGKIWAESEPGQGSTFFFTIVFGLAKETSVPSRSPQLQARRQIKGIKILLAEDNLVNRILAVEILQNRGHRVVAVENGRQALEKLRKETFDLVIMDIRMPEMGGEEATRRIRLGEAGDPSVPIVALTAHALLGDRERILAMGMDDYLSKPIDMKELDRILERIPARGG